MDDFLHWLRAQLDEDEQKALAAAERIGPSWGNEVKYVPDVDAIPEADWDNELGLPRGAVGFYGTEAEGEHLNRWAPARALREIDAKRQVLSRYEAIAADVLVVTGAESILAEYRRVLLPHLALPYEDRPGYREEWRPYR